MRIQLFLGIFLTASFTWAAVNTQSCLVCHSSGNASVPLINGQNRVYFEKQIYDFKYKNRLHNKMNEIAKNLSDEDISILAVYFSQNKWTSTAQNLTNLDLDAISKGQDLVSSIACNSCHGANLQGLVNTPRIAGQKRMYIQKQLQDFHSKQRSNDLGQMYSLTQFLTQEDISNISLYLNSL